MKKLLAAVTTTITIAGCGDVETTRSALSPKDDVVAKWEQQASQVTIIRDNWGIPHIYGKTDADTVFGLMYAQAEDDFNRVEVNFLNSMGRLAEAEGEDEIYRDLRMKLFIDPEELQRQYQESPEWLQKLMTAWADGLNYFLHTHPELTPKVLTHFEPWMALSFSEGSIGGDIERVRLDELEAFYGDDPAARLAADVFELEAFEKEPTGSNGLAVAPSRSASGHALLYINPHTSLFFRTEVHMVSEEGLNAYGAVTWGQFFVYQGFNERAGWMHTSSRADAIDWYLEDVLEKDDGVYYRYGDGERKMKTSTLTIPYKDGAGTAEKTFTVYRSHHGPVIREQDGKWVAIKLMEEPVKALTQSYLRTKADGHHAFYETMELLTNSSNNTVYADADGNIAYYHGNFIPKRDPSFDWSQPVDGADPATEWQGLHPVEEAITLLNPPSGYIQNTNNWPFSAAGPLDSPKREDYPRYMSHNTENFRGIHAVALLEKADELTLDGLIALGFDSYLTGFEKLIPSLIDAYDGAADEVLKAEIHDAVEALRGWDLRWSEASTETSLAIYWGNELLRRVREDPAWRRRATSRFDPGIYDYAASPEAARHRLEALKTAADTLETDFGDWRTPWGEINRYQRLTGDIVQKFDDDAPSLPVGFASGRWGSLASFGARTYPGTKRMYGTGGNSFVAAVEFGERVRAKAVTAGGLSNDPDSPHFDDQAELYTQGRFRDVWFYRKDVEKHAEREYHPGQ